MNCIRPANPRRLRWSRPRVIRSIACPPMLRIGRLCFPVPWLAVAEWVEWP